MTTPLFSLRRSTFRPAIIAVLMSTIVGCSHTDPPPLVPHYTTAPAAGTSIENNAAQNPIPSNPPPNTPVAGANAQAPIANNPPPGKPNHLSPDMQAEIEHYRSVGGSTPNR